ncbi:MAG: VCBS repeat-containing protein [Chitinophagaceae bacterium]
MNLQMRKYYFLLPVLIVLAGCKSSADKLFEELSSSDTHIDFVNHLEKHERFSILYYLYYYNGGGVATGDINNDGLPDIYFTANKRASNKLYLNKGNFEFEDITAVAGVAGTADWCSGVTMADVNGDGWLDIYVSAVSNKYGLKGKNELFINQKNGSFQEMGAAYGLDFAGYTTQAAFFDYDQDGDLDCYLLNQSHHPHANIVDTSFRRRYDSLSGDRLYRNELSNGQLKFTDVSATAGIFQSNLGYGLGLAIADFNNDGWDDIYVGNDFHENDYYYINLGNGRFRESGADHFGHYSRFSMGNDAADFNNDGQLDIVTVDMLPPDEKILKTYGSDENPDIYKHKLARNGYQQQFSRNTLQLNNGSGVSFSDIALQAKVSATDWSWCPLLADFDNDGNKDLFISSGIVKRPVDLDYVKYASDLKLKGMDRTDRFDDEAINAMPDGSSIPFLFRGDGDRNFEDVSKAWGTASLKGYFTGAAYADLDNDGRLDLIINQIEAPAVVLKNKGPQQNFLRIRFKGSNGNTSALGAKAYVFTKDIMQYQQLMATRGFQSSSDQRLHFGLGPNQVVDSVLVVWPNQQAQLLRNVNANQQLDLEPAAADFKFEYASFFPAPAESFESLVAPAWKHQENLFEDFNVQYLIPHAISTRGPKLAVADVNGDGLDDFYACGSKGQPGVLMIQNANGQFSAGSVEAFAPYTVTDQTDALFVDVNNDKAPDLIVVSGGNEEINGSQLLADRLYINDGKGGFTHAKGAFPPLLANKSCVAAADVDGDGDQDLFIGVMADARSYGTPQESYLLINDGKGQFTSAPPGMIGLQELGMVTSAAFADVNGDQMPDLVLAGEWMPVKLFVNQGGKFFAQDLPGSTGLWQSIAIADVNNDLQPDLLLGNWGLNSKLASGKTGPLKLYVKDFDNNGSIDQVMAYRIGDEEYTFLAKDELERQMPVLKKAYLTYGEVAGKSVEYMFYDLFKDYRELKAEQLASSVFINKGNAQFQRNDLPAAIQESPVFSFAPVGSEGLYITGGNFYDVVPYEGRYDARALGAIYVQKSDSMVAATVPLFNSIQGQVRDMRWLRTVNNGRILLVARNNAELLAFKRK